MLSARRIRRAMPAIVSCEDGTDAVRKIAKICGVDEMIGAALLKGYVERYGKEKRESIAPIAFNQYGRPTTPEEEDAVRQIKNAAKRQRKAKR